MKMMHSVLQGVRGTSLCCERRTFTYTAYGLGICSVLPLPELLPAETASDVVIQLARVNHSPPESADPDYAFWATLDDEAFIYYEKVGTIQVRQGCEVMLDPVVGVEEKLLRFFVMGPCLGTVLYQRGFLVLHANTVNVNGNAVAFVGETGLGKSTTAAAFYAQGHSVVSDDVTAVNLSGDLPMVYPGIPQLKLLPDTVALMGDVPDALPRLYQQSEKRARRVVREFPRSPLPLRAIYVLTDADRLTIEPLSPRETFMAGARHTYYVVTQFLRASGNAVTHFRQCEQLARKVSIRLLKRRRDLAALPDLVRFVEQDVAQMPFEQT
jgi:hypothetical protein